MNTCAYCSAPAFRAVPETDGPTPALSIDVVGQSFGADGGQGGGGSSCAQGDRAPAVTPQTTAEKGSWQAFLEPLDIHPSHVREYIQLFQEQDLRLATLKKTMKRGDQAVERALKASGVEFVGHVQEIVNAIAEDIASAD